MDDFLKIKSLSPILRCYPWALTAIVFLGVLSSLAEGIGISLFIPFFQGIDQTKTDSIANNWLTDFLNQFFSNYPPDHRLTIISVFILGSITLKAFLSFSSGVLYSWLDARIGHRLRSSTFEQLLSVSYKFLQSRESGDLWNTLTTETWRTSQALSVLIGMTITLFTFIVYVILLLLISWQLCFLVITLMLFISLIVWFLTRQVKSLGKQATRANAALANRMLEGFAGMKVIRAFSRENYEQKRFDQASEQVSKIFLRLGIISGIVNPVYEILAAIILVSILLFSTLYNPINLPSLLVFIFVLYRLQPKIKALDAARVKLSSLIAAVEEVTSLLDRTNKPYIHSGKIPYRGLKSMIRFEQVNFRYDSSERLALQNISLLIPAGKTTAFVGPSGAGKSTLINLIFRFYEILEGDIYVDDCCLKDLDLYSWRDQIAMVSQDVYLFNTTVRDNIAYGRLNATDDEIVAAARQANAHKFICQLPQGYNTKVGNEGIQLSGGQQQRITLARAIVRNPDILILDEATNSLDSISEQLIQEALDTLSQNRTVIVIAHRLSTIERADHIIVLDEGCVREQGSLQDLLKINGLFAKLYDLQYRKVLAE